MTIESTVAIKDMTDVDLRKHRENVQQEYDNLHNTAIEFQRHLKVVDTEINYRNQLDDYYRKHPSLIRVKIGDKVLMTVNTFHRIDVNTSNYLKREVVLVVDNIQPQWFGKADGIHVVGLKEKYSREFNPQQISEMRRYYLEAYE